MSLALTNSTINKYFGFLTKLDNRSKKKIIIMLTESIETEGENKFNLKDLFGAWEDSRNSDEIIEEIRKSRIEKKVISDF